MRHVLIAQGADSVGAASREQLYVSVSRGKESVRIYTDDRVRDYLRTDEYVEFMARRVFGLVKPGEVLVIVDAPKSPAAQQGPDDAPLGATWWQRLFSAR